MSDFEGSRSGIPDSEGAAPPPRRRASDRDSLPIAQRPWFRHGLPGLAGSTLVAIGALGIGWLPLDTELLANPVVEALRSSLAGTLTARCLVFVGLAILLQAWLVLGSHILALGAPGRTLDGRTLDGRTIDGRTIDGRTIDGRTIDGRTIDGRTIDGRMLMVICAMWCAPLLLAPPLFSRDVYSYYVQGRLFAAGSDPTTVGVAEIPGWFQAGADPMWAEAPTPYGPAWLLLERAIAEFTHPNAYLAGIGFRLSCLIGVALLAIFVPRLAQAHGVDPATATWLAVLNPLVVMHFVSGAHNDALMAGLLVLAFWLGTCRRCTWAAVLVGCAIAIKPIAVLALPFIGLQWAGQNCGWAARIRAWALATLVAGSTLACWFLLADAGRGLVTAAFGTPSGVLTWLSPPTAVGQLVGGLTTLVGLTSDTGPGVAVLRAIGLVAAIGIVAWLICTPDRRSPLRGAALALGTVVILGPVVQPWYLLWFLPLFAASGLTIRERQVAVFLTAAFTVHGMVESSTTSDNFLDITDGITFLVAVTIVAIVAFASPRERRLIMGGNGRMRT